MRSRALEHLADFTLNEPSFFALLLRACVRVFQMVRILLCFGYQLCDERYLKAVFDPRSEYFCFPFSSTCTDFIGTIRSEI